MGSLDFRLLCSRCQVYRCSLGRQMLSPTHYSVHLGLSVHKVGVFWMSLLSKSHSINSNAAKWTHRRVRSNGASTPPRISS